MVPYKNNALNEVDHTIMVRKILEDPLQWLDSSVNHDFTLYVIENLYFSNMQAKLTPRSYIKEATWRAEALRS